MPLSMASIGDTLEIKKVGGKEKTQQFLEKLGFVAGEVITVISGNNGSMIVNVKDSHIAIGMDMANKIVVK